MNATILVVAAALAADPGTPLVPASPGTPSTPAMPTTPPSPVAPVTASSDAYVLGHTVKDIDGKDFDLSQLKGKVVVFVNVASDCGLTDQYIPLQALNAKYSEQGLVVVGFPANNFGNQEPGSNQDIKKLCTTKYKVTFPMMSKISVKGADQHALYKQIAALPAPLGGDPTWNFTKIVVDRRGNAAARFSPKTTPDDPAMVKKLEELLAEKAG